jgi:hypothetical protein
MRMHRIDVRGIDVRGIDVRGIDLRGIDVRGIDVRGPRMRFSGGGGGWPGRGAWRTRRHGRPVIGLCRNIVG